MKVSIGGHCWANGNQGLRGLEVPHIEVDHRMVEVVKVATFVAVALEQIQ